MAQRRRRGIPKPKQPEYMRRLRMVQGMPRRKAAKMSQRLVVKSAKYLLSIPSPTAVANILCKIACQRHPYDAKRIADAIRTVYLARPNDYPVQWMILRTNKLRQLIIMNWEGPAMLPL